MKVWTLSEAYADHNDTKEVSSYVEIFKTEDEANECFKEWVKKRIAENFAIRENYDTEDEWKEEFDKIETAIIDSNNGYGWFRYVGDCETVAWNITVNDI